MTPLIVVCIIAMAGWAGLLWIAVPLRMLVAVALALGVAAVALRVLAAFQGARP
jgi:hypothetical protein